MSKKNAKTIEATEAIVAPQTKVMPSMEELESKGLKTKSAVIRYLDSEGHSRSAIAKFLNIRYQHVRNVLTQPLKKTVIEVETK